MKKIFFSFLLCVLFCMILMIPAQAQDEGQKKVHVVIEENGIVTTDTSVFFCKDASGKEIQAAISCITGMQEYPCKMHAMHRDTLGHPCKHMQKSELDTLLEVSGKPFVYKHGDSCRHSHDTCLAHTGKAMAGQGPCKHAEKEIIRMSEPAGEETVIIEDNGDIIIRKGQVQEGKCIRIIIESDTDTIVNEKVKEIRIIEIRDDEKDEQEGCGEKTVEKKIIITEEGDKVEKTIIMESPAETEKKAKKVN